LVIGLTRSRHSGWVPGEVLPLVPCFEPDSFGVELEKLEQAVLRIPPHPGSLAVVHVLAIRAQLAEAQQGRGMTDFLVSLRSVYLGGEFPGSADCDHLYPI
jgi:hypothetical protein